MPTARQFFFEKINMMRNPASKWVRRSNNRDSHRATSSASLNGAIKIESCCRRYHRLPVAWCLNFSLKPAKFRSEVFLSLSSASRGGEPQLREDNGPKRHRGLEPQYHRLKSVD